jgi:hypothetical protein
MAGAGEGISGAWTQLKELLDLGFKKVPGPTKIVLAALILFLATVVILQANLAPRILFPATIGVLVIGVVVTVVSGVISGRQARLPGQIVAWGIVLVFVAVLVLFVSAAFFGWPAKGALFVARVFSDASLVPRDDLTPVTIGPSSSQQTFDVLPATMLGPLVPSDPIDRVEALGHRPPLVIDGAVVSAGGPGQSRTIAVPSLTLRNGSIVTNGADIVIEVIDLIVENGSIQSFETPASPRPGKAGRSGGTVRIRVHGSIVGTLRTDLSGEAGTPGKNGTQGSPGPAGAKGDNAASGLVDCSRGAGRGRAGGPGGPGGDGEPGLPGGAGGTLIVVAEDVDLFRPRITFDAPGGSGGSGGEAGQGGPGGPGGPGGSPVGLCSGGGPTGDSGPQGPPGQHGSTGPDGADGVVRFIATPRIGSES